MEKNTVWMKNLLRAWAAKKELSKNKKRIYGDTAQTVNKF